MPIAFAIEFDGIGLVEHGRIAIGGGQRQNHALLRSDAAAVQFDRLRGQARNRNRRISAQQFFDRSGAHHVRLGQQLRAIVGVLPKRSDTSVISAFRSALSAW